MQCATSFRPPSARVRSVQVAPQPVAVDVWLTDTTQIDERRMAAYAARLDAADAARYGRFLVQEAALQFVVARTLSRAVLSRYAAVAPQDWEFEVDAYGKPRVKNPVHARHLRFNLAHTNGLVACVVAMAGDVGVYVEDGRRNFGPLVSEPGVFSDAERESLLCVPAVMRRRHLVCLWTLKEAYSKARGAALAAPLDALSFEPSEPWANLHCAPGWGEDPQAWRFHLSRPTPWHQLAIAVQAPPGSAVRIDTRWLLPPAEATELLDTEAATEAMLAL